MYNRSSTLFKINVSAAYSLLDDPWTCILIVVRGRCVWIFGSLSGGCPGEAVGVSAVFLGGNSNQGGSADRTMPTKGRPEQ